ncbi:MAG: hypothetical protein PHT02_14695 [Tissierellia bacterium]|nr:hypothetical protein [Tissierellia bacterium]
MITDYFDIKELVCPHTYQRFGQGSWIFLDPNLLKSLLILRADIIKLPMVINNYSWGGNMTQRGLRCNLCDLVKSKTEKNQIYLSAHCLGKAVDISIEGMTAEQTRRLIELNQDLLPVNHRVEGGVSWLHFDIYDSGKKFHEFNA